MEEKLIGGDKVKALRAQGSGGTTHMEVEVIKNKNKSRRKKTLNQEPTL